MKKLRFLFLLAFLCLSGCGGRAGEPVTVSAPAPSASSGASFSQQLQQKADLEGAGCTDGGVYYRPSRFFESGPEALLPGEALTMGQAAQRANDCAAAMGLPVTGLVWNVSFSENYEIADLPFWSCDAALPPYTSYVVEYQGTLEDMQPGQRNWSVTISLDALNGRLLQYYCSPVDPFDLKEHTAEERQEHERRRQAFEGSEECRRTILDAMDTLGVGPAKRLLPPDDTCLDWRAELENGDTYFAGAFYGKKELYELQYSTYYINGDQINPAAKG